MSDRRVVVTGIGAVSAAGWGVDSLREALRSGRVAIGLFDRFEHSRQRTHVAGQVPPMAGQGGVGRNVRWNRLSNSDRFGLFAAYEAIENAGLPEMLDAYRSGVFFGSSTGGLFETERYIAELIRNPGSRPRTAPLASHLPDAPAETVARHLRVSGPVETTSSACASGGLAIAQALWAVRNSEIDLAIVGGADCLCITTYSGFNSLRSVDERPCRPFRTDRAGLSLGEGGAVLILEALEHAQDRGATPLAEVLGAGATCDASHMTAPSVDGRWAALAIERGLDDAGIGPGSISFVSAHGTGTPLNDAAEWAALLRVFRERTASLPVEVTKGVVGHLLGAAGIIAAVSVVLGLVDCEVHPAPGSGEIDPSAAAALIVDGLRAVPDMRAAVSLSLGFGGANAAVVWGRWDAWVHE